MNVTDNALMQLKQILEQQNLPKGGVRIFAMQGCCAPSLQMTITDGMPKGDKSLMLGEVQFYIETQAEEMLTGVTVDYKEGGFIMDGLKKNGSCSC